MQSKLSKRRAPFITQYHIISKESRHHRYGKQSQTHPTPQHIQTQCIGDGDSIYLPDQHPRKSFRDAGTDRAVSRIVIVSANTQHVHLPHKGRPMPHPFHRISREIQAAAKYTNDIFTRDAARFIFSSMYLAFELCHTEPVNGVRFTILRPRVTSSAYSNSSPTEMPRAITDSLTPNFSSLR